MKAVIVLGNNKFSPFCIAPQGRERKEKLLILRGGATCPQVSKEVICFRGTIRVLKLLGLFAQTAVYLQHFGKSDPKEYYKVRSILTAVRFKRNFIV